jgi:peptidyl-prolyl cis-trans isomerase B (cyclophilin B)
MRFLPLEVTGQLRHNAAGVVAMAHSQSLDSGSCQFYITMSPQPHLDGKYSIFGGVLSGMDVVPRIVKGDKINSISVQEIQ